MALSVSDDAGKGGGNCTFDRERETINRGEGSVGLNGQGHHIHFMWRGPSFFLIVILTILSLCLGHSQEVEVTSFMVITSFAGPT